MNQAYIALGSNLGDRLAHLQQAVERLSTTAAIEVLALSPVYETAPVGGPKQGPYYNACAHLKTTLSPTLLLLRLLAIEAQLGRTREEHWGPRTIDLDLLVYENYSYNTPLLILPHPRMLERNFVLVPLADLAPGLIVPGQNLPVRAILHNRQSDETIKLIHPVGWPL